jgi:cytochrome c-type biogenesis protein
MTVPLLLSAFAAGLFSFLSPCVLPLVPVYIAQLVGPSVWQAQMVAASAGTGGGAASDGGLHLRGGWRFTTLTHAVAFVAGFALAFVALGATASALGAVLSQQQEALRRICGVALVVFGLHVAGFIRLPGLERERRYYLRTGTPGYVTSLALGFVFAVGWTPCVGPFLTGVLLLAAQAGTLSAGVVLLAVYALGLGVPFLAVAVGFDRLHPTIKWLGQYLGLIERVAGILLAALGVAVFFNWLLVINSWFIIRL